MNIQAILKQFNFKESETTVYLALLQNGSCTGYEAAKCSGVPRSKIYNVLDDLFRKGAVEKTINKDKNNRYKAVGIHQLRNVLMTKTNSALDAFVKQAVLYEPQMDTGEIWLLQDTTSIELKINELITSAKEEILIQMWQPQLTPQIERALIDKEKEGKRVLFVLYDLDNRYQTDVKNVYRHGYEKEKLAENGQVWLTIVIDNAEMLHVSIANDIQKQAFSTKNGSLVYFAREYILHDAYCLKLMRQIRAYDQSFNMDTIRDVF